MSRTRRTLREKDEALGKNSGERIIRISHRKRYCDVCGAYGLVSDMEPDVTPDDRPILVCGNCY